MIGEIASARESRGDHRLVQLLKVVLARQDFALYGQACVVTAGVAMIRLKGSIVIS